MDAWFGNLHFLRPEWFLALLPMLWFIVKAWQVQRNQGAWHQVIAPQFRKLLLGSNEQHTLDWSAKTRLISFAVGWFFTVFALSGPWVKAVELPAQKSQQGVVIMLDLSLSMLADDIAPNRLKRAKFQITDLVESHPEIAKGLLAYAGSAHTITPISEDKETLLGLLPSLNPMLMPEFGAKPLQAFALAEQMLQGANITHGHIIWLTDDIEANEVSEIERWVSARDMSVAVLSFGTPAGGVVKVPEYGLMKDQKGQLILPTLPRERFQQLDDNEAIDWFNFKTGENLTELLMPTKLSSAKQPQESKEDQPTASHPMDLGPYFLFFVLPIALLLFRRGTLLNLAMLALLPSVLLHPQPALATPDIEDYADVLKTQDQLGYDAWKKQNYGAAEAQFNHPQWRASALYRQGKYAEAIPLFAQDKSAQGFYNLGNAKAMVGDLEGAKEAYEAALQQTPKDTKVADNLAVIEQLLQQQKSQQQQAQQNAQKKGQQQGQQPSQDTSEKQSEAQSSAQDESQQSNAGSEASDSDSSDKDGASEEQNQENKQSDNNANQKSKEANSSNSESDSSASQAKQAEQAEQNGNKQSTQQGQKSAKSAGKQGMENEPSAAEHAKRNAAKQNNNQSAEGVAESQTRSDSGAKQERVKPEVLAEQDAKPDQASNNNAGQGEGDQPGQSITNELSEKQQAQKNWLKQIPDQPGLFLQRKFEYQFQQSRQNATPNDKQW